MDCNESNCMNEFRLKSLEDSLRELRESNSNAHKDFYKRIGDLERDNVQFASDIQYIKKTTEEMNENIKTLMDTPRKRYETIVTYIITTIVGAVIGFLLSGAIPM